MGQLFAYEIESLPSHDAAKRAAVDAFLREHGWTIHGRPKDGEPLWHHPVLGVFAESDALDYEERSK